MKHDSFYCQKHIQDHRELKKETHFGIPSPNKVTGFNVMYNSNCAVCLKKEYYRYIIIYLLTI